MTSVNHFLKVIGVPALIVTIIGASIATTALIPAFGQ